MPALRLEYERGWSRKFWRSEQNGCMPRFEWGRIGRPGRSLVKRLPSPQQATEALARLVRSEVRKGYCWRRPRWVQLVLPLDG